MINSLSAFKAYDVRGRFPNELSEPLAYALGIAIVEVLGAKETIIGYDARISSNNLRQALVEGLARGGAAVTDIGLCGTEEIYYATANYPFDVGIMITGSHNPKDENGFKLIRRGAIPVSNDTGLLEIRERVSNIMSSIPVLSSSFPRHLTSKASYRTEYIHWLLNYSGVQRQKLASRHKPLRIVADAGNGCAGLALHELAQRLPFEFVYLNMEPDGSFPNGVPNPLLPERRAATSTAVRNARADIGIAWDGDYDRCFFYDSDGNFIEGYYCIGLLAHEILGNAMGDKIVHDTRVYWNTQDIVRTCGGKPIRGKTGHAFMKELMRAENAIYGGEMSGHHYFRDFAYCDSGMLPWLMVINLLQRTGRPLGELVAERMQAYPCSGEINRRVLEPQKVIHIVRERYISIASHVDNIDGINLEFSNWRFNLRMSNTEQLLRLNVETRGDRALMEDMTSELLNLIDKSGYVF